MPHSSVIEKNNYANYKPANKRNFLGLSIRISWLKVIDVSGTLCLLPLPPHRDLKVGTYMAPETSVTCNQLTWLTAREDFFNFIRRESSGLITACAIT
jgi:hypothetical protein